MALWQQKSDGNEDDNDDRINDCSGYVTTGIACVALLIMTVISNTQWFSDIKSSLLQNNSYYKSYTSQQSSL